MAETLNLEDIEVLIEALGKWETADSMSEMTGDLLGIILSPNEEKAKEYADQSKAKSEERKLKGRVKAEQSILLKAKLIHMKDGLIAESVFPPNPLR